MRLLPNAPPGKDNAVMDEQTKIKPAFPFELDPVIEAYKKDVDLTLLRENLKLTVEERFLKLMRLQEFAEELRKAGRQLRAKK